jgi:hypothetical protein
MLPKAEGGFGYWRDPVFLICLAIYVINRALIKPSLHHYSPFFHGHLDDTLTVPVALPLYLWVYRLIQLRPDDEPPRWWEVALHVALWDVFFEWFGPKVLHQGVGDPLDNWSIAVGGIMAWALWKASSWKRMLPAKESR